MNEKQKRFRAIQEEDGTWSVLDISSGRAVALNHEPMVLLGEAFAKTLADFLNLEEGFGVGETLH